MKNILVVMLANEAHRQQLAAAAPDAVFQYKPAASCTREDAAWADVIIGSFPHALLSGATRLKLLQLNSAGIDAYLDFPALCPGARMCSASGAYGLAISEHMLGMLLALMKKLTLYRDNQYEGRWEDLGPVASLYGSRVLCVGLGDIGTSFAALCAACGAHVTGIRRTPAGKKPDCVDAVYAVDHLDTLLPDFDVVFLSLPQTPATMNIMSAERIARMKPGAYLLNAGRGSALDQAALLSAVRGGKLAGAALDVTTPEPLSPDHPLWREPRIFITPHIAGQYHLPATHDKIIAIACENLRALEAGTPLRSEANFAAGY